MTSAEFMEYLQSLLDIGDRQVRMDNRGYSHHDTSVFVHYYNLPLKSVTRAPHFSNFEADALMMEIGRAYKHNRITDEERELLAGFLDARRG